MMKKQETKAILSKLSLTALIWILVFQSPLESIWEPFSYIDELTALIGACLGMYDIVIVRKGRPSKDQLWMGALLLAFVAIGLAGNLLYRYQPWKCVVIDLYTNLKFFFAIGTGYYLFAGLDWEDAKNIARWNASVLATILFAFFVIDQIFCFWPAEVKYGIHSAKLFYYHPTYLAGAVAFLLVLMTVFYHKKNIPFIAMTVIIMAFTLRAKAMASAAMYVAMYVFFIVLKLHLKLWHVVVAGAGVFAIGWEKIRYTFFDRGDEMPRAVMMRKSFEVMRDHAPIGTGFGAFGSAEAGKHYSAVYQKYGFNDYFYVRDVRDLENTMRLIQNDDRLMQRYQRNPESYLYRQSYLSDHFWPIIFGQTGYLGTAVFLVILAVLLKKCFDALKFDLFAYVGVLFAFVFLLISSMAEPAFHNMVAIPLAMVMGMVFCRMDAQKQAKEKE